jgi:hypothetical protein
MRKYFKYKENNFCFPFTFTSVFHVSAVTLLPHPVFPPFGLEHNFLIVICWLRDFLFRISFTGSTAFLDHPGWSICCVLSQEAQIMNSLSFFFQALREQHSNFSASTGTILAVLTIPPQRPQSSHSV